MNYDPDDWVFLIPDTGTKAAERFYGGFVRTTEVIMGRMLPITISRIAKEKIEESAIENKIPITNAVNQVMSLLKDLEEIQQNKDLNLKGAQLALLLVNVADNYLAYLCELVTLILKSKPEALRSSKTVTLEQVLSFDTISDFIEEQIESEVTGLAQKGYKEIKNYFAELNLGLSDSEDDAKSITRVIEDRNLFVHRRGIVDRRYLRRLTEEGFNTEGIPLGTKLDEWQELSHVGLTAILKSVLWIDQSAKLKYSLDEVALSIAPRLAFSKKQYRESI